MTAPAALRPDAMAAALRWPLGVLLAGVGLGHGVEAPILVNESPSLPRGIYARAPGPIRSGSVVALAQPSIAKPYLSRLGLPSDLRLLKRVAAGDGDLVCAQTAAISVAGRVLPLRAVDRRGGPLPAWRQCRRLGPGEVFLLGDSADSFDSRYFGPTPRDDLIGPYHQVLEW